MRVFKKKDFSLRYKWCDEINTFFIHTTNVKESNNSQINVRNVEKNFIQGILAVNFTISLSNLVG